MLACKGSLGHRSLRQAACSASPVQRASSVWTRSVSQRVSCSLVRRNRAQALPTSTTVVAPSQDGLEESGRHPASSSGADDHSSSSTSTSSGDPTTSRDHGRAGATPAASTSGTFQPAGAVVSGMAPIAASSAAAAAAAAASHGSGEPAATPPAPAPPLAAARSVTPFDRLAAALVFMLPFSEGMYRLALLTVDHCRRNALDLLVWSQVQQASLAGTLAERSGAAVQHLQDELRAARMLAEWSQTLYGRLDEMAQRLLALTQAPAWQLPPLPHVSVPAWLAPPGLPAGPVDPGAALTAAFGAPAAMWTLGLLLAAVAIIASAARHGGFDLMQAGCCGREGNSAGGAAAAGNSMEEAEGGGAAEAGRAAGSSAAAGGRGGPFGRPEVPLLAAISALLLRVSLVPMGSLGGGAGVDIVLSVYRPAAVLLTLASTFIALAAALKLLGTDLKQPKAALKELVAGVKGVVLWHRALLLLDWLLALCSALPLAAKAHLLVAFGLYGLSVEFLTRRAEAVAAQLR